MKTTVVNIRTETCDVYIGRPSKWGNPFVLGRDGDRKAVVNKFRIYLETRPDLLADLHELQGKKLGCYCFPLDCHGDVLAELADDA